MCESEEEKRENLSSEANFPLREGLIENFIRFHFQFHYYCTSIISEEVVILSRQVEISS
jgi:hypothetical protein